MPAAHQKKPAKKSARVLGFPRVAVIAGAGLLVMIGIFGGMALDLVLHTPDVRPPPPPIHPANRPMPIVRNTLPPEDEPPSMFDRPATPETHPEPTPDNPPAAVAAVETPLAAKPVVKKAPEPPQAPVPETDDAPITAYAVASAAPASQPVIAIVIDDMGLDRTRALRVIALPGPVNVSLMTYADDVAGLASRARAAGHEILAHVPMEPLNPKEHPGPGALTVAMDNATIQGTLAKDLDGWRGYVGINNHMGSRFTQDRARMAVLMGELKTRGLLWLDSRTTNDSVGGAAAQAAGVPYVERDVFLDNTDTVDAVLEQLNRTVAAAKSHGTAIAIGHPHEATIEALTRFLPTLESKGVALAPITEVRKRRQEHVRPS